MHEIGCAANKERLALIIVGYSRIKETKRLLDSLESAFYPEEGESIQLVISIDASGNKDLYSMVESYQWNHGDKYVIIHSERLGLKDHVFYCGNLSKYFKGIVVFEDDVYASPYFYSYVSSALDFYKDDQRVAGISLYTAPINALYSLPFDPLNIGSDVYAYQDVASWGEAFNYRMWAEFSEWMQKWDGDFDIIDMPEAISSWSRAWSKYYYAFLVSKNKYFIYPFLSLTSNFNDSAGEHGEGGNKWTSFSLLYGQRNFVFLPFKSLSKYDVYCHNVDIYNWLDMSKNVLNIDLYGTESYKRFPKKYLLTTSILPYKIVSSFALTMRPMELNILLKKNGEGIYLYDTSIYESRKKVLFTDEYLSFQLKGFNPKLLFQYIKHFLKYYIKAKICR